MSKTSEQSNTTGLQLHPLFQGYEAKILHGSFSLYGGVSKAPFASHNISFGVGDKIGSVKENRLAIKEYLALDALVSAQQVHGDKVYVVDGQLKDDIRIDGYDALVTSNPKIGLMIGHADCQPILLYDRVRSVIAAIHSGWRGSVVNITKATLSVMQQQFQTNPGDCVAGVGPSLGPCCSEFINFRTELPQAFQQFQVRENYFDFWQITQNQLLECGVEKKSIHIAGICTSCSPHFFSYRRACRQGSGITGRNGSVIALQ